MFKSLKLIEVNIRAFRRSPTQLKSKFSIQEGLPGRIERVGNLPSVTAIFKQNWTTS